MDRKPSTGFTLLELIVAMAVAAILMGIGVPSFLEVMKNGRLSTQHNELMQSLSLARSEAIKGTNNVVVCARKSDTECSTDMDDWKKGWLVYADGAPFDDPDEAQIDAGDTVLRVSPPLTGDNYIIAEGSADRTIDGLSDRVFIRYQADGSSDWQNGFFEICDGEDDVDRARAINVVLTGDVRRARATSGSSKIPVDVFGQNIDCQ